VSHKRRDEKAVMEYHRQLKPVLEDQLCLASIHYLRNHYQEAIDIYKQELLKNRHVLGQPYGNLLLILQKFHRPQRVPGIVLLQTGLL
jgi:hypothetical protein